MRELLPPRRRCQTFPLQFGGFKNPHTITVGYYDDGRPGEVFIGGGKSGELVEAIARDGAILLSMVLQHGVSLDTVQHALTRDSQDDPMSIVGAVVEALLGLAPLGPGQSMAPFIPQLGEPLTVKVVDVLNPAPEDAPV